jgi:exopolysaccharide biosynthesis polyprenyl glycosylphosphotransferase
MKKGIYKRNLAIPFLKIVIDAISIEAAFIFSFWLRFYSPLTSIIPPSKGLPPFSIYFYFSFYLLVIYIVLFSILRAYRTRIFTNLSQDLPVIFKVCFLGILFAMSGAFLYREFSYSRLVFLLILINTNVFLILGRLIFHSLKKYFIQKGFDILKVYLVGSNNLLPRIISQLQSTTAHTFEIMGYVSESEIPELAISYKGDINRLPDLIANDTPEGLVLAFNQYDYHNILEVMSLTEGKNIELFYIPDILDLLTSSYNTIEAEGLLLLQLKAFTLSGWQGFLKRIFDIFLSFVVLLLLAPLFLFLSMLIKITSKGPVFYLQKRVGMDGNEFNIIKFRSMGKNAEATTGPVWAKKDDARVTLIGKFLRRTSLDELPQLINVLRGDMSLIGPRPERPHFVKEFQVNIPKYLERHRVRSGITGWAQVNGLRGQSPIEERTKYDIHYIENWSIWFDIKIIILTFIAIFKGENAY